MNNDYNINDWARDQRNAQDAENILELASTLRLKFPRINMAITVLIAVISFIGGLLVGIDANRQPLGILLIAVSSSAIMGFLAYLFSILILVIVAIVLTVVIIKPYL